MDTKLLLSVFETMAYSEIKFVAKEYEEWYERRLPQLFSNESTDNIAKHIEDSKETIIIPPWNDGMSRATLLFKLAQAVEKKKDLFSCVESISSKKPISRTRERDIPELIQHLYSAAHEVSSCPTGWIPHGLVGVLVDDTSSPTLCKSLNLGPALAAGNSVILCVSPQNCQTALLLADTAKDIGFPDGVLHVTCEKPELLVKSFDLILQSASCPTSVSSVTPYSKWQPVTRPKAIVTDTADIASAAHGVIELSAFNSPLSPQSGACVLVQESIYNHFWKELSSSFKKLRSCSSVLDKTGDFHFSDLSKEQAARRKDLIGAAKDQGAEIVFPSITDETLFGPILVRGIDPTSSLLEQTSACIQVLWIQSFRHYKEAVTLANAAPFADYISIWGEQTSAVLEIAKDVRPHYIWINTQNAVDFTGSLSVYDFLSAPPRKSGSSNIHSSQHKDQSISNEAKLSAYIKKAGSLAKSAFKKWNDQGADSRAKLLFLLAGKINSMESSSLNPNNVANDDCSLCAKILYKYASQAAIPNFGSKPQNVSGAKALSWVSARGVIGVVLPEEGTLHTLVSVLGSALAFGNTLLALVPDEALALKLAEILTSLGFPAGVANLVSYRKLSKNYLECLLNVDVNTLWILKSLQDLDPLVHAVHSRILTISSLDLSSYDWKENPSEEALMDWFQRQSITIKKVWLEGGVSG